MPVNVNEIEPDEKIVEIEMERLREFRNHPFKVKADGQMLQLIESIISGDRAALACGMCVFGGGRAFRYTVSSGWRCFHTLCYFKLWLRTGAMGSRSKDDYRRDRFPGNTDSRYFPDCRHRITKDLYFDNLRNSRDTTGAYPEWVCPCFLRVKIYNFLHCPHARTGNLP